MNDKINILNKLSKDCNIYINSYEQYDDETLVAKSHFLDFWLNETYIQIVKHNYSFPGPRLRNIYKEYLPFRIDYEVDLFYDILRDTVREINDMCRGAEYKDEEND